MSCAVTSTHKANFDTQISGIFFLTRLFPSDSVWSLSDTSVALSLLAVSLARSDSDTSPWLQGLCMCMRVCVCMRACAHVRVLYLLCIHTVFLFDFFFIFTIYFSLDWSCWHFSLPGLCRKRLWRAEANSCAFSFLAFLHYCPFFFTCLCLRKCCGAFASFITIRIRLWGFELLVMCIFKVTTLKLKHPVFLLLVVRFWILSSLESHSPLIVIELKWFCTPKVKASGMQQKEKHIRA